MIHCSCSQLLQERKSKSFFSFDVLVFRHWVSFSISLAPSSRMPALIYVSGSLKLHTVTGLVTVTIFLPWTRDIRSFETRSVNVFRWNNFQFMQFWKNRYKQIFKWKSSIWESTEKAVFHPVLRVSYNKERQKIHKFLKNVSFDNFINKIHFMIRILQNLGNKLVRSLSCW